jgi:hypothetical protein
VARNRRPNGLLGKVVKSLTDALKAENVDPNVIKLKFRNASALAGSAEAVRRIIGDEAWEKVQEITAPAKGEPQPAKAA